MKKEQYLWTKNIKWKNITDPEHSMIRMQKCDLPPHQLNVLFRQANMHLNCGWNYEILSTLNKNNSFRNHKISSGWPHRNYECISDLFLPSHM